MSLNKQDSIITYKVVNHTNTKIFVVGSITRYLPEEMKGSFCCIEYKDKKGDIHFGYLSVAKKFFYLNHGEAFSISLNISQYMKEQIVCIKGWVGVNYRPSGVFESRRFIKRKTIKF